jgi:hypothetical protein
MSLGPRRRLRRPIGLALSLAAHLGVLAAVLTLGPAPSRFVEPDEIPVALVAPRYLPPPPEPKPAEAPAPPSPAPPRPTPPKPAPALHVRRPVPPPPDVVPLRAAVARLPSAPSDEVSDAELASAAGAGAGSGSGSGAGCDMAGWLQAKLRADPQVRAALAAAHPARPLRLWNGAWVPHPGQEGAGLARVREAIMWEVAFAPVACRTAPVHGLVVLALDDGPAPPRVVLGAAAWRWSDMLHARSTGGRG